MAAPSSDVHAGEDLSDRATPLSGTQLNDPVFYLNHCNVDRLWEAWQARHGRVYQPPASAPAELRGHRLADPMHSLLTREPITPSDVLDLQDLYTYDTLP